MVDPRSTADDTIADLDLSSQEVRRRAVSGSVMVAMRGVALRAFAFAGSLVLARLLVPSEFGVIALGASMLILSNFFTGGGLGGALIRRKEAPRQAELSALLGLQLVGALVIVAIAWAVSVPLGRNAQVVALMVSSLPLMVLRTPGAVLLERRLAYGRLVTVELSESLSYYGFGITAVAIGWGVWGLAAAAVVRAAVASGVTIAVAPGGLAMPSLRMEPLRGLLAFGLKMQGVGLVSVIFEQSMNAGIAAIGGLSTLGLWALAKRVIEVPSLLFEALWRVSFPAMSRLMAAGEELRPTIERGVALGGVTTGVILLFLVGGGPSVIPLLFGSQWKEASDAIPWAAIGIMVSAPVSVATSGYLYAVGDVTRVLQSAIFTSLAWLVVALGLLPVIGLAAVGIGLIAGGIVDSYMLGSAAARHSGARIVRPLVQPVLVALVAGAVGWWVGSQGESWLDVAAGIAASQAIFLSTLFVLDRNLVLDMIRIPGRALRRRPAGAASLQSG